MRVLLMINPKARRGEEQAADVRAAFEELGCEVVQDRFEAGSAAATIARYRDRIDAAVIGGGDGTLRSAIPAFVNSDVPLGVIPLGTFNDLARALRIPLQPAAAVRAIVEGHRRTIDIGSVNGRYFLTEASIGISTQIARRQTPGVKRRFGFAAVMGTTLATVWRARPFRVSVAYDGQVERFRTIQLTVANSFHFGGLITNKAAAIDDGKLDLYSLKIERWSDVLPLIRPILKQEVRDSPSVRTRQATRFDVSTQRPRHVFADGEPATVTPATFDVLPRAVTVFVPKPPEEGA